MTKITVESPPLKNNGLKNFGAFMPTKDPYSEIYPQSKSTKKFESNVFFFEVEIPLSPLSHCVSWNILK